MTTFPIDYFAPNNGQTMDLEERVNKAFTDNRQITISELGKSYNSSQVAELMSDVKAYFSKNSFSSCVIVRAEFEDDEKCFEQFREAQIYSVPPTSLVFDSKQQFESFINYVFGVSGTRAVVNHLFSCKRAKFGLALNLKDYEIKGLVEEDFPIILYFKSIEDLYDFASAYINSKPFNSQKEDDKTIAKLDNSSKKRNIIITSGVMAIAVIIILHVVSTKIKENQARELQEQYNAELRNRYAPNKDIIQENNARLEAKKAEREMLENRLIELRREYDDLSRQIQNTPVGKDELFKKRDRVDAEAQRIHQELLFR